MLRKSSSPLASSNRYARPVCVSLFFLGLLLLGLGIYSDYGISWDEPTSRANGLVTLHHLAERYAPSLLTDDKQLAKFNIPLDQYFDRDYGVAFELPVSLLERLLQLDDTRDIYLFRHLVTFLVFVGGVFAVFSLAERRFDNWRLGLLVALCLVISPRFFAESYYNSKDVVFMAIYAIAINTTVMFIISPAIRTALINGLATAIAIDVRIMAVILPLVTILILLFRLARCELFWRKMLLATSVYIGTMILFVIILWPWLWSAPWSNFSQAFTNMANFRWMHGVLYMGEIIPAPQLPWHYIPVWIAITTPVVYSALFFLGAFSTIRRMFSRRLRLWKDNKELQDLIFLGLFVSPLLAVIALDSVLYDGWRQMYFLYPSFLLVALRGWVTLWNAPIISTSRVYKTLLATMMIFSLMHTASWIATSHPFQNVYFNFLAGKDWKHRFEVDYWGLSNRKALEYILEHDSARMIKIWPGSNTPIATSLHMVKSKDRSRILVVDNEDEADYILTNYRANATDYASPDWGHELFYQISIDDEIICSVFKSSLSQENG